MPRPGAAATVHKVCIVADQVHVRKKQGDATNLVELYELFIAHLRHALVEVTAVIRVRKDPGLCTVKLCLRTAS